jgi:hypothetical protein
VSKGEKGVQAGRKEPGGGTLDDLDSFDFIRIQTLYVKPGRWINNHTPRVVKALVGEKDMIGVC